MTTSIDRLRRIADKLQDIIDEADDREITEVKTQPNTYDMHNFVSLGSDGFLDLDADVEDLLVEPDEDDE